jgi:hypothetical protein
MATCSTGWASSTRWSAARWAAAAAVKIARLSPFNTRSQDQGVTEEQIEALVEVRTSALDRTFLSRTMTSDEYDRALREIDRDADRQRRKSSARFHD